MRVHIGDSLRLFEVVRAHLCEVCGIPGGSLTPQEVPFALATTSAKVPAELVASVLEACELARYAPPQATPSADACREAIEHVEQMISDKGAHGTAFSSP